MSLTNPDSCCACAPKPRGVHQDKIDGCCLGSPPQPSGDAKAPRGLDVAGRGNDDACTRMLSGYQTGCGVDVWCRRCLLALSSSTRLRWKYLAVESRRVTNPFGFVTVTIASHIDFCQPPSHPHSPLDHICITRKLVAYLSSRAIWSLRLPRHLSSLHKRSPASINDCNLVGHRPSTSSPKSTSTNPFDNLLAGIAPLRSCPWPHVGGRAK